MPSKIARPNVTGPATRDDGTYQNMKIPTTHVVHVADKLHRECKQDKKFDLRSNSIKIVRENWSTMERIESGTSEGTSTYSASAEEVESSSPSAVSAKSRALELSSSKIKKQNGKISENAIRKEPRKMEQHRPESYCSLAQYYREQYQGIKKPRKQETVSEKRMSRVTKKGRPMTVSTQNIRYVDKDVSSAILSSQHLAKQVQRSMHSTTTTQCKSEGSIKMTKINNFLRQGIPKFSLIDDEFQELCKSKPVERITSGKETPKRQNKGNQNSRAGAGMLGENILRFKKPMQPNIKSRPSVVVNHRQTEFRRSPIPCYSRENTEKIQVPKHIYIRERGIEVVENLVEVRNQDDLDILNTVTTLHPLRAAAPTGSKPVKLFEKLRDSEVYYYPITM